MAASDGDTKSGDSIRNPGHQETEGSVADDQKRFARHHRRPVYGFECDADGFGKRGHREGHRVGNAASAIGADKEIVRKRALEIDSEVTHLRAKMAETAAAFLALATGM